MSFAPLENDVFLRACRRLATPYTPVWLMRQAGRYLEEYRATRARAGSFMGLATNVDYATEVTLQPLERYAFDAATSIRRTLNGRVPLIGFAGSPWTLACYMVEGAGSDDYRLVKTMLYSRPDLMHRILQINAEAVAAYL